MTAPSAADLALHEHRRLRAHVRHYAGENRWARDLTAVDLARTVRVPLGPQEPDQYEPEEGR